MRYEYEYMYSDVTGKRVKRKSYTEQASNLPLKEIRRFIYIIFHYEKWGFRNISYC